MTSARQSAMVFALSLMFAFLSAEGVSMQEKVLSRSAQDLKVQTSSKVVAADWTGNEDNEDDDDDDDDDDNDDDGPKTAAAVESEKAAADKAAAAADAENAAADAENAAEAALMQTAKPQPPSAAEKAAAEAERAAEVTELAGMLNPKKALVQHDKHTHQHHKHHEVDQQILIPPQASPAPALPPSFSAPAPALTPSQLAKERALAKKEDELEGKITPHAVEKARLSKNVMMLEQELHTNLQEQSKLEQRIEYLSNEARSDQEIDASAGLVANETNTPAMANMMGRMWKEMRMFDVPMYAEHVAEKLRLLKKDEHKLEAKLEKAKGKLAKLEAKPAEAPAKKALGEEALGPIAEHVEDALAPKAGAPVTEHVEAKTAFLSKLNFWGMSTGEQQFSLASSLVYLVAGVTLAFIFNKVRSSKPKLLTVAEKSGTLPNSSDFSFSIFGCFDALNADGMPWPCLMGCCCPSLRWAQTVDGQGLLPYWKAFFAFFILTALHCYSYGVSSILVVGLGVVYRQKLRQKYSMEGGKSTIAMDILVWLCCQPCAIIQEAREESVLRSGGMADSSYSGP